MLQGKVNGRIGGLFGSMPYGAGMNFKFVAWDEKTAEELLPIIEHNLAAIKGFLVSHQGPCGETASELNQLQKDLSALRRIFGTDKLIS